MSPAEAFAAGREHERARSSTDGPVRTSWTGGPRPCASWAGERRPRCLRRLRGRRRRRQVHPGRPARPAGSPRPGARSCAPSSPGRRRLGRAAARRAAARRRRRRRAARTEALLYAADKAQHLYEVVRPALARGAVVVCDRYVDSMIAYQGAGRVLDPAEVERIARWATEDLRPDLTVLLDLAPEEGLPQGSTTGPARVRRRSTSTPGPGRSSWPWPRATRSATWCWTPAGPATRSPAAVADRVGRRSCRRALAHSSG